MKSKKEVIEGDVVWVETYIDSDGDKMIRCSKRTSRRPTENIIEVDVLESYNGIGNRLPYIKVNIPLGYGLYSEDDGDDGFEFVNEDCWEYDKSDFSPISVQSDPIVIGEPEKPHWKVWSERMHKEKIEEESRRPKDGPFEFL